MPSAASRSSSSPAAAAAQGETVRPILFVDHAPALGGAERSLLLLFEHLDRRRWRPHLAATEGAWLAEVAALGVPVHSLALARLRGSAARVVSWFRGAREIAGLAQRIGACLLHANTTRATAYTALAARLAGRPFVWHVRDFWLTEARPRRIWADRITKRILCASARAVVANSESVASHLPCRRVTVVHNGIDVASFDPAEDGTAFRRLHGIAVDAPLAGMVGRLRPWKGQEAFLRAAVVVLRRVPAARFVIVGGDPFSVGDDYAARLTRLAAELGVGGRVVFTGHLADVRAALAAMDVFVHPGDPEPLGLANLEAMAMQKPIVAFAQGALTEIVVEGETGMLVRPGDVEALGAAVTRLLEEPDAAEALGRAARLRVAETFDARTTAARLERLYDEILGG